MTINTLVKEAVPFGIEVQEAVADFIESWLKKEKSPYSLTRTKRNSNDDKRGHDMFLQGPDKSISLDITLQPAAVKNYWNVVRVHSYMFEREPVSGLLVFKDEYEYRKMLMDQIRMVLKASLNLRLARWA